jgi:hypothetical protein
MSAASEFRTSQLFVEVLPYSDVPCVYCEVFNLTAWQIGHMGECPICDEMKYFGVTQGTGANATHQLGLFVDSLESRGAQMQVELITSGLQHDAVKAVNHVTLSTRRNDFNESERGNWTVTTIAFFVSGTAMR